MADNLQTHSVSQLLKTSPLFSQVQADALTPLAQHAQKIQCGKNEYIQIDVRSDYFYIVDSGSIMLSRVTHDGEKFVVDILDHGGVFGVTNLFDADQHIHIIAEAIKDTKLWRVPISVLKEIVNRDNKFTRNFLCMNLDSRLLQDLEIEHRTVQNVSQRIGCFLLSQCAHDNEKTVSIKLPYNKNTIAAKLGVRSETFSRALQKLEKETKLRARGSHIHISDIDKLKSYVCPSCSLNYPCHTNQMKVQLY